MKFKLTLFLISSLLFCQHICAEKSAELDLKTVSKLRELKNNDAVLRKKLTIEENSKINSVYPNAILREVINCKFDRDSADKVITAFNVEQRKLMYFSILSDSKNNLRFVNIADSSYKNDENVEFYGDVEDLGGSCMNPSRVKQQNKIIDASIGADGSIHENLPFDVVCLASLGYKGGVGGGFSCYSYDTLSGKFEDAGGWVP